MSTAMTELPPRQLITVPPDGPAAPRTRLQGRQHGSSFSPLGLSELISSIASHGVLQPLLVEEISHADGQRHRWLVTGERRLRACRIGATENPNNPRFAAIPALICRGPLSDAERNAWQISENLSREDLQPGQLAAALLTARTDMLRTTLTADGNPPPVLDTDDVVARWHITDQFRARTAPSIATPWAAVLTALGISFGPRKARLLVAAFGALPPEISSDMDAHEVSLASRTTLVHTAGGQREFAADIWAAVKALGRPELLTATSNAVSGGAAPGAAAEDAARMHDLANAARSEANRTAQGHSGYAPHAETAAAAAAALRTLMVELQQGAVIDTYTGGTLRLLMTRLIDILTSTGDGQ